MLGQELIREGVLKPEDLDRAIDHQRQFGLSLADSLVTLKLLEERDVLRALARQAGLQFLTADKAEQLSVPDHALERVPVRLAESLAVCPFRLDADGALWVLTGGPIGPEGLTLLKNVSGSSAVNAVLGRSGVVQALIRRHYYRDRDAFRALQDPSPMHERAKAPDEPTDPYPHLASDQLTGRTGPMLPADVLALERENERLRTAQLFASRLAGAFEFDVLADRILGCLFELFQADGGTFLLVGDRGAPLLEESRVRQGRMGGAVKLWAPIVERVLERGEPVALSDARKQLDRPAGGTRTPHAVMCAPILSGERVLGALYLESDDIGVFSDRDAQLLTLLGRQVAVAVETANYIHEREYAAASREALGRFLPPARVRQAAENAVSLPLHGQRLECTALSVRVKGLQAAVAPLAATVALSRIEGHLEAVIEAIHRHDGAIVSAAPDEVLALFGAPVRQEDHAERAVAAARAVLESCSKRLVAGLGFEVAVGVATAEVLVGRLGASGRLGYAALGEAVDEARELSGRAEPGRALASDRTRAQSGRFDTWNGDSLVR